LIRGGDAAFFQLGAGPCKASMTRIDLEGFYLLLNDFPNRTASHVAAQKGTRVVHLLLHWSRSLYWNGMSLDRPGVIVWGDSCDYCRVGTDVRTAALVIEESKLRERIETWASSSQRAWDSLDGHMLADTPQARRFAGIVEWVCGLASRGSPRLGVPAFRAQLSERLLFALVGAVEAQGECDLLGDATDRQRTRIVRQITDHLYADPNSVLEISDLCRLTGCSARTIAYACQTVLETSPMRYLRQLRLNRARILLRQADPEASSVSECAYSVGFTHLGRFSAEYRRLFGELPRQTLGRSG
jgi:AraC family ethanolamine operon transcriptional activator